jgi:hypothetical protein
VCDRWRRAHGEGGVDAPFPVTVQWAARFPQPLAGRSSRLGGVSFISRRKHSNAGDDTMTRLILLDLAAIRAIAEAFAAIDGDLTES